MNTEAISLALGHALVQEIVAGRTYTATAEQLWHGSDHVLIGSGVLVEISPPGTFEKDWPYTEADVNGHPIYPAKTDRYKIIDASEILVLVDLVSHQVADISPGAAAGIDYLTTRTPPPGR
jgi:hypothetical protein